MAIILTLSHDRRPPASHASAAQIHAGQTAKIVILPCIRRERIEADAERAGTESIVRRPQ